MAKGEQKKASAVASGMAEKVGADVKPIVDNASGRQQTLQGNADASLGTSGRLEGKSEDTYSDFAKTGGFTPNDETTFINRATRGVKGTYDVLRQAAERRRTAAGGLGTGGADVAMARQGGQAVAEANTDAMAELASQKRSGKLAGAGGLSGLYGQTNALFDSISGHATAMGKQVLDALGLKYNTEAEAGQILANLSKNPGMFDNIMRVAPVASGFKVPKFGSQSTPGV